MWNPTHVLVTVIRAKGLKAKGKSGTNDAYVSIKHGKEKYQTSVKERSKDPEWNEKCQFPLREEEPVVKVKVFHRNLLGKDDLLGCAEISLEDLRGAGSTTSRWYALHGKEKSRGSNEKSRGEIECIVAHHVENLSGSQLVLSNVGKTRKFSLKRSTLTDDKTVKKLDERASFRASPFDNLLPTSTKETLDKSVLETNNNNKDNKAKSECKPFDSHADTKSQNPKSSSTIDDDVSLESLPYDEAEAKNKKGFFATRISSLKHKNKKLQKMGSLSQSTLGINVSTSSSFASSKGEKFMKSIPFLGLNTANAKTAGAEVKPTDVQSSKSTTTAPAEVKLPKLKEKESEAVVSSIISDSSDKASSDSDEDESDYSWHLGKRNTSTGKFSGFVIREISSESATVDTDKAPVKPPRLELPRTSVTNSKPDRPRRFSATSKTSIDDLQPPDTADNRVVPTANGDRPNRVTPTKKEDNIVIPRDKRDIRVTTTAKFRNSMEVDTLSGGDVTASDDRRESESYVVNDTEDDIGSAPREASGDPWHTFSNEIAVSVEDDLDISTEVQSHNTFPTSNEKPQPASKEETLGEWDSYVAGKDGRGNEENYLVINNKLPSIGTWETFTNSKSAEEIHDDSPFNNWTKPDSKQDDWSEVFEGFGKPYSENDDNQPKNVDRVADKKGEDIFQQSVNQLTLPSEPGETNIKNDFSNKIQASNEQAVPDSDQVEELKCKDEDGEKLDELLPSNISKVNDSPQTDNFTSNLLKDPSFDAHKPFDTNTLDIFGDSDWTKPANSSSAWESFDTEESSANKSMLMEDFFIEDGPFGLNDQATYPSAVLNLSNQDGVFSNLERNTTSQSTPGDVSSFNVMPSTDSFHNILDSVIEEQDEEEEEEEEEEHDEDEGEYVISKEFHYVKFSGQEEENIKLGAHEPNDTSVNEQIQEQKQRSANSIQFPAESSIESDKDFYEEPRSNLDPFGSALSDHKSLVNNASENEQQSLIDNIDNEMIMPDESDDESLDTSPNYLSKTNVADYLSAIQQHSQAIIKEEIDHTATPQPGIPGEDSMRSNLESLSDIKTLASTYKGEAFDDLIVGEIDPGKRDNKNNMQEGLDFNELDSMKETTEYKDNLQITKEDFDRPSVTPSIEPEISLSALEDNLQRVEIPARNYFEEENLTHTQENVDLLEKENNAEVAPASSFVDLDSQIDQLDSTDSQYNQIQSSNLGELEGSNLGLSPTIVAATMSSSPTSTNDNIVKEDVVGKVDDWLNESLLNNTSVDADSMPPDDLEIDSIEHQAPSDFDAAFLTGVAVNKVDNGNLAETSPIVPERFNGKNLSSSNLSPFDISEKDAGILPHDIFKEHREDESADTHVAASSDAAALDDSLTLADTVSSSALYTVENAAVTHSEDDESIDDKTLSKFAENYLSENVLTVAPSLVNNEAHLSTSTSNVLEVSGVTVDVSDDYLTQANDNEAERLPHDVYNKSEEDNTCDTFGKRLNTIQDELSRSENDESIEDDNMTKFVENYLSDNVLTVAPSLVNTATNNEQSQVTSSSNILEVSGATVDATDDFVTQAGDTAEKLSCDMFEKSREEEADDTHDAFKSSDIITHDESSIVPDFASNCEQQAVHNETIKHLEDDERMNNENMTKFVDKYLSENVLNVDPYLISNERHLDTAALNVLDISGVAVDASDDFSAHTRDEGTEKLPDVVFKEIEKDNVDNAQETLKSSGSAAYADSSILADDVLNSDLHIDQNEAIDHLEENNERIENETVDKFVENYLSENVLAAAPSSVNSANISEISLFTSGSEDYHPTADTSSAFPKHVTGYSDAEEDNDHVNDSDIITDKELADLLDIENLKSQSDILDSNDVIAESISRVENAKSHELGDEDIEFMNKSDDVADSRPALFTDLTDEYSAFVVQGERDDRLQSKSINETSEIIETADDPATRQFQDSNLSIATAGVPTSNKSPENKLLESNDQHPEETRIEQGDEDDIDPEILEKLSSPGRRSKVKRRAPIPAEFLSGADGNKNEEVKHEVSISASSKPDIEFTTSKDEDHGIDIGSVTVRDTSPTHEFKAFEGSLIQSSGNNLFTDPVFGNDNFSDLTIESKVENTDADGGWAWAGSTDARENNEVSDFKPFVRDLEDIIEAADNIKDFIPDFERAKDNTKENTDAAFDSTATAYDVMETTGDVTFTQFPDDFLGTTSDQKLSSDKGNASVDKPNHKVTIDNVLTFTDNFIEVVDNQGTADDDNVKDIIEDFDKFHENARNQIADDVRDVDNDVRDINDDVRDINNDVGDIKDDVRDINDDVRDINDDVSISTDDDATDDTTSSIKGVKGANSDVEESCEMLASSSVTAAHQEEKSEVNKATAEMGGSRSEINESRSEAGGQKSEMVGSSSEINFETSEKSEARAEARVESGATAYEFYSTKAEIHPEPNNHGLLENEVTAHYNQSASFEREQGDGTEVEAVSSSRVASPSVLPVNHNTKHLDEPAERSRSTVNGIDNSVRTSANNRNDDDDDGKKADRLTQTLPPDADDSDLPPETQLQYYSYSRNDLIRMLLEQRNTIQKKDAYISDLENYIDNLVLKVIDVQPKILLAPNEASEEKIMTSSVTSSRSQSVVDQRSRSFDDEVRRTSSSRGSMDNKGKSLRAIK